MVITLTASLQASTRTDDGWWVSNRGSYRPELDERCRELSCVPELGIMRIVPIVDVTEALGVLSDADADARWADSHATTPSLDDAIHCSSMTHGSTEAC